MSTSKSTLALIAAATTPRTADAAPARSGILTGPAATSSGRPSRNEKKGSSMTLYRIRRP